MLELADKINDFWLGDACTSPINALKRKPFWYEGSLDTDEKIRVLFGDIVQGALAGNLEDWCSQPQSSLALILLLDQFSRNLFRGSPKAYSGDAQALRYLRCIIKNQFDAGLHVVPRIWLYHPLHHSECLDDQDQGRELLEKLLRVSHSRWHNYIKLSIAGWSGHREIIKSYGRFPHRNFVLERINTPREEKFLELEGRSFGQGPTRIKDNT